MDNHNEGPRDRHTPGRQQMMVRLPEDLYRWLHRTSVLQNRRKTHLMTEAVRWIQSRPDWADHLHHTAWDPNNPRRISTFDLPRDIHTWLRLEASEQRWSANELAGRVLQAWRNQQELSQGTREGR